MDCFTSFQVEIKKYGISYYCKIRTYLCRPGCIFEQICMYFWKSGINLHNLKGLRLQCVSKYVDNGANDEKDKNPFPF